MRISSRVKAKKWLTKQQIADDYLQRDTSNGQHLTSPFLIFKNSKKENLIDYHHSIGRNIRNTYGLWNSENPSTKHWHNFPDDRLIIDGIDCSQDHPDAVSFDIIVLMWESIQ